MRLLRLDTITRTWRLEDFSGQSVPFYAVFSHRWGLNEDEVSMDIQADGCVYDDKSKPGYDKLRFRTIKSCEVGFAISGETLVVSKRRTALSSHVRELNVLLVPKGCDLLPLSV
jgi:hypothetical protein